MTTAKGTAMDKPVSKMWLPGVRRADTGLLLEIVKGGEVLRSSAATELCKRGYAGTVAFIINNQSRSSHG